MADINQITIDLSKTYTDSMQQDAIHEIDAIAKDVKSNGMPVYENCVIVTDKCGCPFLQTQDGNLISIPFDSFYYGYHGDIHGENDWQNCSEIISENEYTSSDTNIGHYGAWQANEMLNYQYVITGKQTHYGKPYGVNIKAITKESISASVDGVIYRLEFIPASYDISKNSSYHYSEKVTDQSGNVTYKVKFKLIPTFKFTLAE